VSKTRGQLNSQIIEEASEWFVEFNTGETDAATRQRFDQWLRASPQHLRAYLEILSMWEDVPFVDPEREVSIDELVALSRGEADVVSLEGQRVRSQWTGTASRMNHRRVAAALLGCACVVAGLLWFYVDRRGTYSTDIGEQRVVTLSDGSNIELNARSRVKVRFTDTERDIDLLEGQALFRVEKDPRRPFIVRSGDVRVRAVGTQFDVYRRRRGTTVTVLEGRVTVVSGSAESRSTQPAPASSFVSAGEQVTATAVAVSATSRANVTAATGWRQRQLIFSATPLTDVAEEFNRYNERQLVIRDARLADLLISGIFASTDPASLVRFLRAQPDINVEEDREEIRLSKK
jgi:transmembrane sensor